MNRFAEAASLIPEGLWTSYGEIAAATAGTRAAARAVGRAAARDESFPNAWRVIHADGSIPAGWGGGGAARERCRQLLEAEGVAFSGGRADADKKILAEEIELLLAGAQAAFPRTS